MLKAMKPVTLLRSIGAEERLDINIIVQPFDIGIGVVIDVVFLFPYIRASSHNVEGAGHNMIDGLAGRIATVGAIVKDIEPDSGHNQSGNAANDNRNKGRLMDKNKIDIGGQKCYSKNDSLAIECHIAGRLNVFCFEIIVNSFSENIEKGSVIVREFYVRHVF